MWFSLKAWRIDEANLHYLTQVTQDWEVRPFINIGIIEDEICPPNLPDEVFYDIWEGTNYYCDCSSVLLETIDDMEKIFKQG